MLLRITALVFAALLPRGAQGETPPAAALKAGIAAERILNFIPLREIKEWVGKLRTQNPRSRGSGG
jgi:hypothetical protein